MSKSEKHKDEMKHHLTEAFNKLLEGDFSDQGENNPIIARNNHFMKLRSELIRESDRGCVLLAVSHIDFQLEKMLQKMLIGSQKHIHSLFNQNGPLATFSSRVKLSYSLGHISKDTFDDIECMRKLRNYCAHTVESISFNDIDIATIISKFKVIDPNFRKGINRKRFITTTGIILSRIDHVIWEENKYSEREEHPVVKKELVIEALKICAESLALKGLSFEDLDPITFLPKSREQNNSTE